MKESVLVIGSNGQIGTELLDKLRDIYGEGQVIGLDVRAPAGGTDAGNFVQCDILNATQVGEIFKKYKPSQVYHLAAVLSATGEKNAKLAWDLNMNGLFNVLDACLTLKAVKVFWPSSIAVFGPNSPRRFTPQYTVMDPITVYGISKLAGEQWCEYYQRKHRLEIRSLRYPGIISHRAAPGGGTTDYAVHIFYEALKEGSYSAYLSPTTVLPMIYMADAIRGTLELMEAEQPYLRVRNSYNMAGMSFDPQTLAVAIQEHLPHFKMNYIIGDPRQHIADSWPQSIDDSYAQTDWQWEPQFALEDMVADMFGQLRKARTGVFQ